MKCFQINLNHLLQITLLGRETLIPPRVHFTRNLDEYVLYAVTNGSLHMRVSGNPITLVPGDVYLFEKGESQTEPESGFCEYYYMHFQSDDIRTLEMTEEAYCETLREKRRQCLCTDAFSLKCYDYLHILIRQESHIHDAEQVSFITETLQHSILNTGCKEPEKRFALSGAAATVLIRLESLEMRKNREDNEKPEKNYDTAKRIADFIENHCTEPIKSEDIEQRFFITFNHANRVFRRVMGCTIFRYRNIVRIQSAKARLRASNMAISDIAAELGFENVHYFSRVFRQIEGLPPSDYKRKFIRIADDAEHPEGDSI